MPTPTYCNVSASWLIHPHNGQNRERTSKRETKLLQPKLPTHLNHASNTPKLVFFIWSIFLLPAEFPQKIMQTADRFPTFISHVTVKNSILLKVQVRSCIRPEKPISHFFYKSKIWFLRIWTVCWVGYEVPCPKNGRLHNNTNSKRFLPDSTCIYEYLTIISKQPRQLTQKPRPPP